MKKILYLIPEVFFIGLAAFWINDNYSANGSVNYFAVAIIAIMIFQLLFQNRIVGFAVGGILTMFSLYMVLAVRSEHIDFPPGSAEGLKFLIIGEGLFLLYALTAIAMICKFATLKSGNTSMRLISWLLYRTM
jgi:hypothetical protein